MPLFRPPSHLAYLCRSAEVQDSYISGTQSLRWRPAKSASCSSLQLLSLSSLHSPLSLYQASACIPLQFVPLPNLLPSQFLSSQPVSSHNLHTLNIFPHQPLSSQLLVTPACISFVSPLPKCTLACTFPHQPISSSPDSSSLYSPVKGRILRQPQRFLAPDMHTPSPSYSIKL